MSKLVIIGRHGKKDTVRKEDLSDESIGKLYSQGVDIATLFNVNVRPESVVTFNSQRVRTEATNKARLAGILGLMPVPATQADVLDGNKYPALGLVDVNGRHGLGYYNGEMNEDVFIAGEKIASGHGGKACTEFGLNNLDARLHEGMKILPFGYIVAKSAGVIQEAIQRIKGMHLDKKDLAMIASHAVITDAGIAALVASGKPGKPGVAGELAYLPKTVDEIGGSFAEGNYAVLYLAKSGRDGVLFRDSEEYPVNLGNFSRVVGELQEKYPASMLVETKRD